MTDSSESGKPAVVPTAQQEAPVPPPSAPATRQHDGTTGPDRYDEKSFLVTWLFAWILGFFAVDRFYLGKVGTGLLKLLTFAGFGVWYLVDLIIVLVGAQRDKQGHRLAGYDKHKKIAWIVTAAFVVLSIIVSGVSGAANSGPSTPAGSGSTGEPSSDAAAPDVTEDSGAVEPANVIVPDVIGLPASVAIATLRAAGFETDNVDDPDATVTATTPANGGIAAEGSTVVLTVEVKPKLTLPQQNAVGKAQSYVQYQAFSRSGLIKQLEFEGYSTEDATFAVDYIAPDWNAQAAAKAKSYLENQSFSRQGLYDQLVFEDFSDAEANAGLAAVGY
jgi:TM2 domain-containing membrane protein YozV